MAARGARGPYASRVARRESIMNAAVDVLAEVGYHGMSLRDVARKVGISHPGFTDQNRVILGASAQYLDYAANLLVTPNHRVQLPVHGALRQVVTVLLQGFESGLGVRRSHLRSAAGFLYGFAQFFGCGPGVVQNFADLALVQR